MVLNNGNKSHLPLKTNSKNVFKFSGEGDVTNMLAYPNATAAEMARPSAADLPRPRAAVSDTVLRRVFSDMASINLSKALPCPITTQLTNWY